jgi:hypothetical protein
VAEAHATVGIVSSYYLKGTTLMGGGLPYPSTFLPGRTVARLQLQHGLFFFGSPTAVLFRTEVVRQTSPFYDSTVLHADTEACYRTLREWDFGFVHEVLSFLRMQGDSRMGAVRDYAPEGLDKLIVVMKFGRDFLDSDEYRVVEHRTRNRYFRMLGECMWTRRDPAFWSYHREGLMTIGYRLRWYRIWRYILFALADLVSNPKKTLGRLAGR